VAGFTSERRHTEPIDAVGHSLVEGFAASNVAGVFWAGWKGESGRGLRGCSFSYGPAVVKVQRGLWVVPSTVWVWICQ